MLKSTLNLKPVILFHQSKTCWPKKAKRQQSNPINNKYTAKSKQTFSINSNNVNMKHILTEKVHRNTFLHANFSWRHNNLPY